jgi:hypothetical protein
MMPLDFAIDLILSAALWPLGSTQSLKQMSTKNIPWGKGQPALKANNLTAISKPNV